MKYLKGNILPLFLGAVFGSWIFNTVFYARAAEVKPYGDLFDELKVFTDVLAVVQRDYFERVDSKKLVEGAIKGMLTNLDPHSGYLDPDFYQDLQAQTKGEFGGLGIEITVRDGLLVVVAPMEGSPAERAGIKSGDTIVQIEGEFTRDFSLFDAVKKLRGPKGSTVKISVLREKVPDLIEVKIVRDNIVVRSVRSRYLGDGYGYIRLNQFVEKTGDDLKQAVKAIKRQAVGQTSNKSWGLSGLLLDLRNNPGGLLAQAIKVSDLFLNEGVIVYTDGRIENQKQKYYARESGTEPNYPIVVLVNGGSASAAEIVSGALKDHGRALILGSQTFGKGSVQTITGLPNGGALTLTTALYYTKSGRSIQALGVTPDIEVQDEPADEREVKPESGKVRRRPLKRIRERDLPGAIRNPTVRELEEYKSGGTEEEPITPLKPKLIDPERDPLEKWFTADPVAKKGFDILKTFNIFERPRSSGRA